MSTGTSDKPTAGPVITSIELTPLFVPFNQLVRETMQSSQGGLGMAIPAEEDWAGGEFVIARLTAEDGSFGIGEAFVWLPETGVSPGQVIDTIEHGLKMYVLGESPFNVEKVRRRMDNNLTRGEVAKGLIDHCLYDLMGKISGRPACDLMGGTVVTEAPLAALIPLMDVDSMVGMCKMFEQGGFRTMRLKLGRSIAEDVKITESVRTEVGEDVRIRVDYNQAYAPDVAVRAIKAIEPFGIDLAEQPVRGSDYLGMAYVQKRVDTPLMSHEGCFSIQDIVTLIELGAIGVIGINSERPGGVTNAIKAIDYAEMRGLTAVIHNQPLGVASAMHVHLACAKHNSLKHDTELFGHVMMEDDLIVEPIDYSGGTATLPDGPGWGVELDMDALDKYAIAKTVAVKA